MYLSRLLTPETISVGWPRGETPPEATKWNLIADLLFFLSGERAQIKSRLNTCIQLVSEREKSMSTGIGDEVAIPHASVPDVTETSAALCVLKKGIDFNAIDQKPVRIIMLMIMPKDQFQKHIQTLAAISKLLHSDSNRKAFLKAKDSEALYKKISQLEKKIYG